MAQSKMKKNDIDLSFESALKELGEIIDNLEDGDAQLEDAIKLFERGMNLSKFCSQKIKSAKLQIEKLVEENEGK